MGTLINFQTVLMTGLLTVGSFSLLHAEPKNDWSGPVLTYSNRPLGSVEKPLLLRTFMPFLSLSDEVLGRHEKGYPSPKYNPGTGKDVPGEYQPIEGLPAAIGVNYGAALSFCWDTVECRLLYAWSDGFLDMKPYWGDPERGNRQDFNYVPKLVGSLFYKAEGTHPLLVNGKSLSDLETAPVFKGYTKQGNKYEFSYEVADGVIFTTIDIGENKHSLTQSFRFEGKGKIDYANSGTEVTIKRESDLSIVVSLQGKLLAEYRGSENENLLKGGVSIASGEKVFTAMACVTCHSIDGSVSHGPSLQGIAGSTRKIQGVKELVTADNSYILESIKNPNAKVVDGFPENYMPPYKLKDDEYQALVLYLNSLKKD